MNFLNMFLFLALFISCSKGPGTSVPAPEPEIQAALSAINMDISPVNGVITGTLPGGATTVELGDSIAESKITTSVVLKAVLPISGLDVSGFQNAQTFLFKSSNCPATLPRNRTCTVFIEFTPQTEGPLTETIVFTPTTSITFNANILPKPAPPVEQTEGLTISPLALNLGDFMDTAKVLSVTVSNSAAGIKPITYSLPENTDGFSLGTSTCPATLLARRSCKIEVKYSSSELVTQETVKTIALTINGKIIPVSVTHKVKVIPETEEFFASPSSLDLGNLSTIKKQAFTIKNSFATSVTGLSFNALPSGVSFSLNTCSSSLLGRRSCNIELQFNNALMTDGPFAFELVYLGTKQIKIPITATVSGGIPLSVACSEQDVINNGWSLDKSIAISGMKIANNPELCVVSACEDKYQISGKGCLPTPCSLLNSNIPKASVVTGTLITQCVVQSCEDKYSVSNNSCVPTLCVSSDIANAANVFGDKVTGCSLVDCKENYSKVGNTCSATPCSVATALNHGLTTTSNVTAVSGFLNDNSCLVTECAGFHKTSEDFKLCNPKSCSELTATESLSLGFDLTAATLSGTYPSCALSCTDTTQELAADLKSCVDKVPTGNISFSKDYTKDLMLNKVDIISDANGESIQFYSNSLCTIASGPVLSLPLSSTFIDLIPGDGPKSIYAKIINGTKGSECLSDTITLDQLSPAVAVSGPLINAEVAGNSLVVNGSCSELNPTAVEVSVSLDSVTKVAPCSDGLFSSSFDISALSAGIQTISLSSTDLAGNIGTASLAFSKIICTEFQSLSGNSCEYITPSGSIAFAQTTTKNLTDNTLNILSTSAQKIQMYSDTACLAASGPEMALPLNSIPVTVAVGDGSKMVSAKLINGNKESSCLTASILLDQTAPLIAFTSPVAASTVSGGTMVVTGTCVEQNPSNLNISLTLNSVTQVAACSLGTFTSTFDILNVPVGSATLSASASDAATNTASTNVVFNKTNCSELQTFSGGQCVDNTPTGTLAFNNAYTKTLVGNVLTLTASNSLSYTFFNNNTCSVTTGMTGLVQGRPGFSLDLTLASGDGVKTYYAQLQNGTKTSACLAASTTLDQAIPSATITAPASGSTVYTDIITVSGACTDATSGVDYVNVTISPLSSVSVPCNSGTYMANINGASLSAGSKTISVQAVDRASNSSSSVSLSFARAIPTYATGATQDTSYSVLASNGTDSFNRSSSSIGDSAVQADGKIVVVGRYTSYGGGAVSSPVTRLTVSGAIDGFSVPASLIPADSSLSRVSIQTDGKILISGSMPTNTKLVRVLSSGANDTTFSAAAPFNNSAANAIGAIAVQADGKILLGTSNGTQRLYRLTSTGAIDSTFKASTHDGNVLAIAVQPDGKILIAGTFSNITEDGVPIPRFGLARLTSSGAVDLAFDPSNPLITLNKKPAQMILQPDGNIVLSFNNTMIRILASGAQDYSFFSPTWSGTFNHMALQGDGKIYVAGAFSNFNGTALSGITRLDAYGYSDSTFVSPTTYFGTTTGAFAMKVHPLAGGKILVQSRSSSIGPTSSARVFRFN